MRKNISIQLSNRLLRLMVLALALTFSHMMAAQVNDWVEQQIENYVQGQINSVLGYSNSYLGTFGNMLWESVVESELQDKLNNKMRQFQNYPVPTSQLKDIDDKYGLNGSQGTFVKAYNIQNRKIKSYLYSVSNIRYCNLGSGYPSMSSANYADSVKHSFDVKSIESVLSQAVMDSIRKYEYTYTDIRETLMKDIVANKKFIHILNNHPNAIKIYCNTITIDWLRISGKHLLYWSSMADRYYNFIPEKIAMPNPLNVTFVRKGYDKALLLYNGDTLGVHCSDVITCNSLELLNMKGAPSMKYVFSNITFETDNLGRVVRVKQIISKDTKGKCKLKSELKPKCFFSDYSANKNFEEINYADSKYGAPKVLFNTMYVQKSSTNKKMFSAIKKYERKALKEANSITRVVELKYYNNEDRPHKIVYSYKEFGLNDSFIIVVGK